MKFINIEMSNIPSHTGLYKKNIMVSKKKGGKEGRDVYSGWIGSVYLTPKQQVSQVVPFKQG